jgi:hypothetical protein
MLTKLGFHCNDFHTIITSGEVAHRLLRGDGKRKVSGGRRIVQGKKRNNKVRGAEGTEYLLI